MSANRSPAGGRSSRTRIVMRIATTPSVNAVSLSGRTRRLSQASQTPLEREAHRRSGAELAGEPEILVTHDRDHRVAAGRRVVVEEQDRTGRRHLQRTGDDAFRQELV